MNRLKVWLLTGLAGICAVVIYGLSLVLRRRGDPLAKERELDAQRRKEAEDLEATAKELREEAAKVKAEPLPGAMTEAAADAELKRRGLFK